jgi:hypothetical protein
VKIWQGTTEIADNTGVFDLGMIFYSAQNGDLYHRQYGDLALNCRTPRVTVANTAAPVLTLGTDAPTTVSAQWFGKF